MAALDPRLVVTQDLDSYFVDKDTGLPLANGILTFYQDNARTVLKPVYQLTGAPGSYTYTQLQNPINLSAVGTVQNASGDNIAIYYFPFDGTPSSSDGIQELYYVTCTDSAGTEQFTREAWPNSAVDENPEVSNVSYQNQIANPTFTNVFINGGAVANNLLVGGSNQVFPIAPDWDLVCTGSGTVVVRQIAVTGNANVVTNPPFVLDITVPVGVTQCWLRQRFFSNSGLWSSVANNQVFLSASLIAENVGGGTGGIEMFYSDSGNPPVSILSATFGSSFVRLTGNSPQIPSSNNTTGGSAGFIDIYIAFNLGSQTRVSSIQVIPVATSTPVFVQDFDSSNRNEALQGDYYIPRLNAKTINSFLIGWDFPLNPFQLGPISTAPTPAIPITTTAKYIADQTIAQSASANVNWTSISQTGGITFQGTGTNNAFYLLQYLQGPEVEKMLGTNLSVNVFGYGVNVANPVKMRIYLFRSINGGTFPSVSGTGQTIGTVDTSGVFTLAPAQAGLWEQILRVASNSQQLPQGSLPDPVVTLNTVVTDADYNNGNNDYGFSGWQISDPTAISINTCFAMVVTFAYTNTNTVCVVNSISLVPGDIPCRPSVQTPDEVLRQCQYFYQKSFLPATPPAQNVGVNTGESYGTSVPSQGNPWWGPIIRFPVTMRDTPAITLYNPAAANAQIRDENNNVDWTATGFRSVSPQGFVTFGNVGGPGALIVLPAIHWTADARLGR